MRSFTVLDLLDPLYWEYISGETHPDLYVSWDALGLPNMGGDLYEIARRCEFIEYAPGGGFSAEYRLWISLPPDCRRRAWIECVNTLVLPVLDALNTEGGWSPVGGQVTKSDDVLRGQVIHWDRGDRTVTGYDTWIRWVEDAARLSRSRYSPGAAQETLLFHLEGLGGMGVRADEPTHNLPGVRTTTWDEVLDQIRWICCMAWLSTLQGEAWDEG